MSFFNRLSAFTPQVQGLMRIMSGLLFFEHGLQKFVGFPPGEMAGAGLALNNPGAFAGIFEFVCGALIALGWFTRPAAFLASGVMAFAYFIAHAPQNFFPVNKGGDAAILYCFIFLFLACAGPGAWSVDGSSKR